MPEPSSVESHLNCSVFIYSKCCVYELILYIIIIIIIYININYTILLCHLDQQLEKEAVRENLDIGKYAGKYFKFLYKTEVHRCIMHGIQCI